MSESARYQTLGEGQVQFRQITLDDYEGDPVVDISPITGSLIVKGVSVPILPRPTVGWVAWKRLEQAIPLSGDRPEQTLLFFRDEIEINQLVLLVVSKASPKITILTAYDFGPASNFPVNPQTFKPPTPDHVISMVADYFGIPRSDITEKSTRKQKDLIPYEVCAYLLYNHCRLKLTEIGQLLGQRNHSTISAALKRLDSNIGLRSLHHQAISRIKKLYLEEEN